MSGVFIRRFLAINGLLLFSSRRTLWRGNRFNLLVCLTSVLVVTTTHARDYEPIDGAAIELGGFSLYPSLNMQHYYDSNIIRAGQDESDSWIRVIEPQVTLVNEFDANRIQFGYRLSDGHYYSSNTDHFTDHFFSTQLDLYANQSHRFELSGAYEIGHDARGTVFSIGTGSQLATPDEYKQTQVDGQYFFGTEDATGRVEININHTQLDYDLSTPRYLARDRDFLRFAGTFYYRVAPATDALIELRTTQVNYAVASDRNNPLDSTVNSVLLGLRWNSNANTAGFAKVGYQQKNFDSPLRPDFTGLDWNAGIDWTPVERTFFRLSTARDTFETNGEGNFIDSRSIALTWRHSWLDRLRSSLTAQYAKNAYEGNTDGFFRRDDNVYALSGQLDYEFRRWLTAQLGYQYEQRDSNRLSIDYDRHVFNFNIKVTL